jgi:uncharacterized protein YndB with AHSA1/START domain
LIEHAELRIERRYQTTPDEVFSAWSSVEAKERWFMGPDEWQHEPLELDFRIGGRERSVGGPPGGPVSTYNAVYWDIVEPERIVYSYEMLEHERRTSVTLATVELAADGDGTRLTLTEHGAFLDGLADPALREDGWGSLLDALGRALADR